MGATPIDPSLRQTAQTTYSSHYAMQLIQHTGAHWCVSLPEDWTFQRETGAGAAYYEAADSSAGLYIAVWNIHTTQRDIQEVLSDFSDDAIAGLNDLAEHRWSHQSVPLGEGDLLLDSQEAEYHHRVLRRIIAELPLVLNASFHDYAFADVPQSNARLGALLQSLRLT